jgi:hypothetical protein
MAIALEPFGVICTDSKRIAQALNLDRASPLAQTIGLADLQIACEVLDGPTQLIHYLWRRRQLELYARYVGDEIDLLATYFDNLLVIADPRVKHGTVYLYNRGDPVQRWLGRHARNQAVERPRRHMTTRFRSAVKLLEQKASPGWLTLCLSLLDVPDDMQAEFEKRLRGARRRLRKMPNTSVTFATSIPLTEGTMQIWGFAYRDLSRDQVRQAVAELIAKARAMSVDRMLVMAVNMDQLIDEPYAIIASQAHFHDKDGTVSDGATI